MNFDVSYLTVNSKLPGAFFELGLQLQELKLLQLFLV